MGLVAPAAGLEAETRRFHAEPVPHQSLGHEWLGESIIVSAHVRSEGYMGAWFDEAGTTTQYRRMKELPINVNKRLGK